MHIRPNKPEKRVSRVSSTDPIHTRQTRHNLWPSFFAETKTHQRFHYYSFYTKFFMMTSKILAILAVFLIATMASARRPPTSRRGKDPKRLRAHWISTGTLTIILIAFVGRHRRASLPKLFDNRQVIVMEASNKVIKHVQDSPPSMEAEDFSSRVRDELVYLSFHGF